MSTRWGQWIGKHLFSSYELYWIYESGGAQTVLPLPAQLTVSLLSDADRLSGAPDRSVASVASYFVEDSRVYFVSDGSKPIAACAFWWGPSFAARRKTWKLRPYEAKLVQINTDPAYRGLGIAPALICQATLRMQEIGFTKVYARIWHSNRASLRSFQKAGWTRKAFVVRLCPRFGGSLRLQLPVRQNTRSYDG